jgi:hypothetical protein
MGKKSLLACEYMRIRMAKELKVPPDDIDMVSIINCCERAIRNDCEHNKDERVLTLEDKEEEEAVLGEYGSIIINKFFSGEYPFHKWAENYEKLYMKLLSREMEE